MANNQAVLDTSAVLAIVNQEPGMEVVLPLLEFSIINTVTLAEIVTKLAEWGMSQNAVQEALDDLGMPTVPFDEDQAFLAGMLRPVTRSFGLSLGDRACLALGMTRDLPILTADRNWTRIPLNLNLQLIR